MAQGLGAFTEGLQGGIAARDKMDMNKQYKRILGDKADLADREWAASTAASKSQYGIEHKGDMSGYVAPTRSQMQDPALLRLGKFLGGKMKGMFGGGVGAGEEAGATEQMAISTPEVQPAGPQASGATTYGIPGYADGGRVDETDEEKRARYAAMTEEGRNAPTYTGSGPGLDAQDLTEFAGDVGRNVLGNTRRRMSEWAPYGHMADQAVLDAEGAHATGDAVRGNMSEGLIGLKELGHGLLEDTGLPQAVGGVLDFAGGFLGMDGGGEQAKAGALPTPTPETTDAKQSPSTQAPAEAAIQATVDAPEKSDEQMAQAAMSEGEKSALENLDYKLLVDQGVRPEELPSMSTQDWADYRSQIFELEMSRGGSIKEAYDAMDYATVDTQMRGFNREATKALKYLQTGQNQEAAMALRQAYQYFPNGVGVKFGMVNDPKTGQPAIISMGVDEQTGEATGKPFIITTDRLNSMVEQATNPSAWRTWTKDGHDLQVELAKMDETSSHNASMEKIAGYRAESERMGIEADAAGGGSGGLKQSDKLAASKFFRESSEYTRIMEENGEEVANGLADVMDRVFLMRPDIPYNTIVNQVSQGWANGGEQGVIEYLDSLQGG